MKQALLIALLTMGKLSFAQTSEIQLTSICIQDSIHTPVELYKADNIRLNTLYRELQLCDSLRILELYELNDQKEISAQYKKTVELKSQMLKNSAADTRDKIMKLRRTRKVLSWAIVAVVFEGFIIYVIR
tara:strand:- start:156 stop:545 length:390 start_codon:yes stop_codon:yes gene_type:complete